MLADVPVPVSVTGTAAAEEMVALLNGISAYSDAPDDPPRQSDAFCAAFNCTTCPTVICSVLAAVQTPGVVVPVAVNVIDGRPVLDTMTVFGPTAGPAVQRVTRAAAVASETNVESLSEPPPAVTRNTTGTPTTGLPNRSTVRTAGGNVTTPPICTICESGASRANEATAPAFAVAVNVANTIAAPVAGFTARASTR